MSLSNIIVSVVGQSHPGQGYPLAAVDLTVGEIGSVARALAVVPDPRQARGRRHHGFGLLMAVMSAVLAGARTTVQVAEYVQDLTAVQRMRIGLTRPPPPTLSTLRRFLMVLDQALLQEALNVWAHAHTDRIATVTTGLRHFALDGKSQRGAAPKGCPKPHLLGVLDVGAGVFVAQLPVNAKTNEISMFATVLDQISHLDGVLVTADAMHTQTAHADYLTARGAALLVGVKGNQPTTYLQACTLPWAQIPDGDVQIDARAHGRWEKRVVKVTTIGRDGQDIAFPHARQVAQVTRWHRHQTRTGNRWIWKKVEVAYYLCTLDQQQLPAAALARVVRDHWAIESWHWLRDMTFGQDAHKARTGHIAANLAALRNTAISLLHLAGTTTIARNLRRLARNPDHSISLLHNTIPTLN